MRLYSVYYICKKYINDVIEMKVGSRQTGSGNIRYIENWEKRSQILSEIWKIYPLRTTVRKLYETIPVIYRDQDKFDVSQSTTDAFIKSREKLVTSMETIIDLYESMNLNIENEDSQRFDVKMPKLDGLEDFSNCLDDLNFVFNQCPYLKDDKSGIKFGTVDVGSTWLTFLVVGASASIILKNLGKVIDEAIKIKSHMVTMKMQEEALHSMELKDEVAAEVVNAFKQTNKIITQNCVSELENEIRKLSDAEEKDKVGRSLEKLSFWIDKGMQIYSAIDAPDEIKNIFPDQEETGTLTDDLMKLLEIKNDK